MIRTATGVALGIILAVVALRGWFALLEWRSKRALEKTSEMLDFSSGRFRPVAPGVQYDHAGVAINGVSKASASWVGIWVRAYAMLFAGGLLVLLLLIAVRPSPEAAPYVGLAVSAAVVVAMLLPSLLRRRRRPAH
jgi:uncharacterized membrane protein YccC